MRAAIYQAPEQTRELGRRLGAAAEPGTVIALVGDLGVGKTLLAQGVGAGLGVEGPVTSPTFVLMRVHEGGRLLLVHADIYRLGDEDEAEAIGLPEALASDAVVLVEWADLLPDLLPEDHLRVELRWLPGRPEEREVVLEATGPRHAPLEAALHGPA
jgi:tRNA threonylcarbamoyladenosine biosynthesis protein TsaE